MPRPRLARHFREAGETARWSRYAEQAADLALASGDETTAAVLLRDLMDDVTLFDGRQAARLLGKISSALIDRSAYTGTWSGPCGLMARAWAGEPEQEADSCALHLGRSRHTWKSTRKPGPS